MRELIVFGLVCFVSTLAVPEIWPPDGRLVPNNYVPPTTTPISLPVYKDEERQTCVTRNKTVCRTETITKYTQQLDQSCLERLRDERNQLEDDRKRREEEEREQRLNEIRQNCTKIEYREKCEYDYLSQCKPVYETNFREKCEDKYESKCEQVYKIKVKRECGYETNEVGPICKDIPVRRPMKKCTRQPKRICTQVPLPSIHRCQPPGMRCIQVPTESVDEECVQAALGAGDGLSGAIGSQANLTYAVASANLNEDQCRVNAPSEVEETVCKQQPEVTCKKTKVRVPIYPFTSTTVTPVTTESIAAKEEEQQPQYTDTSLDDLEYQVYQKE